MSALQIVGRTSSLFTRVPLIFAEELGVPYELVPISSLKAMGPEVYAGNPALKMPILREGDAVLFGAQNICRALAERGKQARIVWPETQTDLLSRNAHELLSHCMSAQVQIAMGTLVCSLPADNVYFTKALAGLVGSMRWLDEHLRAVIRVLPERDLSLFEVSLHCLMEHFALRPTLAPDAFPALVTFSRDFAKRPSAQKTVYR